MKPNASANRRRGGFVLHVMPAVLYAIAVFYGGSVSKTPMPSVSHLDKVVHLLAFAGMQLAWFRAVRYESPRLALKWQVLIAAAIASAVGAGLELYQLALRYRSAEFLDWVADTAGAVLAAAVLLLLLRGSEHRGEVPEGVRGDSEPLEE